MLMVSPSHMDLQAQDSISGHSLHLRNQRNGCPCINTDDDPWPYYQRDVPSSIGDNYFCDIGNPEASAVANGVIYANNPLWDGVRCNATDSCCEFNNPPWFCRTLPQPTMDDLEVRNCGYSAPPSDEDVLISLIDIRVV